MDIHQITIRPHEKTVFVLYIDAIGNRDTLVLDGDTIPIVSELLAACREKLPSDRQSPFKNKIEKEITDLEQRLSQLRKAIGVA